MQPRFKVNKLKSLVLKVTYFIQKNFPVSIERKLCKFSLLKRLFFQVRDVVYCKKHDIVYFPIPKVACTTISALLVQEDYSDCDFKVVSQIGIHTFRQQKTKENINSIPWIEDASHSFTVIRDPLSRLVSAYVDKMVKPFMQPDYKTQLIENNNYSFEELVNAVCALDDCELDKHFRPQYLFFINIQLNFIGVLAELNATFDYIAAFIDIEDKIDNVRKPKRTKYNGKSKAYAGGVKAIELAKSGEIPHFQHFYNEHTQNLIRARFAADMNIFEKYKHLDPLAH